MKGKSLQYYATFFVVLTWDDGNRTYFVVRAKDKNHAIASVEKYAYREWEGQIVKERAEPFQIDGEPEMPQHLFTES